MKDKLVAIIILRVYSLLTVIVNSLILILFYKIDSPLPPKIIMIIAILGFLISFICSFINQYRIVKIIVSVLPLYVLAFGSAISKSLGLYNSILFYILPFLISIILLFPPILFFGVKYIRTTLIILVANLIPIILYNQIHLYYGVDYQKMIFNPESYVPFLWILAFFFIVFFLAIFLLQKVQFLNVIRLKKLNVRLDNEQIITKNLNKSLQYKVNLYKVLNIVSKKEDLTTSLTKVLDELFSIDLLGIHKKGIIFKKNNEGNLELITHKNIPTLLESSKLIETERDLTEDFFFSKEFSFYDSFNQNNQPISLGDNQNGHYVIPLKDNNQIIGVLSLYTDNGLKKDQEIEAYLLAVSEIISYRIISENYNKEIISKNEQLNAKKLVLESILSELNDSINYSYQLQKSLVPNQKTLHTLFKQCYCLYLAKDKISGDFYFIKKRENSIIFGIGDCTGHGIPGSTIAAMSIETVNQTLDDNPTLPVNKILELLREKSKKRFSINIDEVRRDSMDSAICEYNKDQQLLYFSGGNINCVLVRQKEIQVYRGTRNPVGVHPVEKPFELKTVPILEGDIIYLFSDGITDQFGYEDGLKKSKKLQRKNFHQWLVELQDHPYEEHYSLLLEKLYVWKRGLEQTDDITIFSIKF